MSRIIIVGCGLGGLAFALKYNGDAQIVIYEKRKREDLGYPWCDTIRYSSFVDNGIELPTFALNKKKLFCMTIPDGKGKIFQRKKLEEERAEVDRKQLIEHFLKLVETKAEIEYGVETVSLVYDDGVVKGIKLDDNRVEYADLVIDSSGAFSSLRSQIPVDSRDYQPEKSETMYYYRGYFLPNTDVSEPEYDSVYLKSLGENSISWVRTAPDNKIDVFIANIGYLDEEFIKNAFADLVQRNSRLSSEAVFVKSGRLALRYPLSRIVFDNYALVGDSAYMSMPMTGSGMDNAIFAGVLLAEVVNDIKDGDFCIKNLWKYQSKYFRTLGSNMYVADLLLKYGMSLDSKDVEWFFNEIIDGAFSMKDIQRKLQGLKSRKVLTSSGFSLLGKLIKGKGLAMIAPVVYEKSKVDNWVERYDSFIRKQ